jgi:RNA polymerase sigma-70 factor, ECF subfamily
VAAREACTLSEVDYADAFVVDARPWPRRSAEDWARATLEGAPERLRRVLRSAWGELGLELEAEGDAGAVLGWRIRRSDPRAAVLEAASGSGARAELLFLRDGDALTFATFLRHGDAAGRLRWEGMEEDHRRMVSRLLVRAGAPMGDDEGDEKPEELRPLLFSIAYRMLGVVGEAEEAVGEAFVRFEAARAGGEEIASPRAYLTTLTTRIAIDQLRSSRVRRETYFGPWLPEPLLTDSAAGPAEAVEMADSLSLSFLVLMERLSPIERAVFLLREVFGYDYGQIAEVVERSEPNCRQILSRARSHIEEGRPRFDADREEQQALVGRFLAAFEDGDVDGLVDLLAADVAFYGDGGGKGKGLPRPVFGRENVMRPLLGLARQAGALGVRITPAEVNGQPGTVNLDPEGRLINVLAFEVADGQIQTIRSVVNPDKLGHLGFPLSPLATRPPRA